MHERCYTRFRLCQGSKYKGRESLIYFKPLTDGRALNKCFEQLPSQIPGDYVMIHSTLQREIRRLKFGKSSRKPWGYGFCRSFDKCS